MKFIDSRAVDKIESEMIEVNVFIAIKFHMSEIIESIGAEVAIS